MSEQDQIKDKISKLLLHQRCNGTTKNEEMTCFKKALELGLIYDIKDVNLDAILRHLYKLEHYEGYSEAFQPKQFETNFEEDLEIEKEEPTYNYFKDYELEKDDFVFKDKYKHKVHNSFVKNIAFGVCLGEISAWMLKKIAGHIKGTMAFVCVVLVPGVIAWAMEVIK